MTERVRRIKKLMEAPAVMGTNNVTLEQVESPQFAPNYGNDYTNLEIKKFVIVKNGTINGNPTVDVQLEDEKGQKFVAMVTGKILVSMSHILSNAMND